ncbi:unnamed protein product [Notodromas monacha]|uniref:Uncharacterized protein n=1 Tax=Notodromas monacha TaxID=399045 RepID=A0A7R9BJ44_9CRUS|nr:unnamed protein product [Notodromas monacha]CAG0915348.1 unnamed protein product [Notodromas monacha]
MGLLSSKEQKSDPRKHPSREQRRDFRSVRNDDLPLVLVRPSSMYFDEDGDLAHAFYEEVWNSKFKGRVFMRRITKNLRPQVYMKYPHPRLPCDSPKILIDCR